MTPDAKRTSRQRAPCVLMVRPAAFGSNPETAASNAFQQGAPATRAIPEAARAEFDTLVSVLEAAGVEVIVLEERSSPALPDSVFPNNWISFHHDGRAVLYPMLSPLRRAERRADAVDVVRACGFECRGVVDLSGWETQERFLEGTGSMVLDHVRRTAYACASPRTCREPLEDFCMAFGYEPYLFTATGPAGEPLYHTNVMMGIGEHFALACLDAVPDLMQRRALENSLSASGRELLTIDRGQMNAFAGNLLALSGKEGNQVIALSATAWRSLGAPLRRALERYGSIVTAAVPTIERHGGGSVRCMLAEVFLPPRNSAVPQA